jgi:hypothetical protein
VFLRNVLQLPVTANVVARSLVILTLIMEEINSSEASDLTRATLHNISEDDILHSHHCENLKPYHLNELILIISNSKFFLSR